MKILRVTIDKIGNNRELTIDWYFCIKYENNNIENTLFVKIPEGDFDNPDIWINALMEMAKGIEELK